MEMSSSDCWTHCSVGTSRRPSTCCEAGSGAFPCIVKVWPSATTSGFSVSPEPSQCDSLLSSARQAGSQTGSQEGSSSLSTTCLEVVDESGYCPVGHPVSPSTATGPSNLCLRLPLSAKKPSAIRKPTSGLSAALRAQIQSTANCGRCASSEGEHGSRSPPSPAIMLSNNDANAALLAKPLTDKQPLGGGALEPAGRGPSSGTVATTDHPPAQALPQFPSIKAGPSAGQATTDVDDGGATSSGSEACDSLPCFSPSLVDRLWAGRTSIGSGTPPQVSQWRLRGGGQRKCCEEGHQGQPRRPHGKDSVRGGSGREGVGAPSAIGPPTGLPGTAPGRRGSVCGGSGVHAQEETRGAAPTAFSAASRTAGVVPPSRLGLLSCQVQTTNRVASNAGTQGCSALRGCTHVPCMAVVAAAAAAPPAPRALGSTCGGCAIASAVLGDGGQRGGDQPPRQGQEDHAARSTGTTVAAPRPASASASACAGAQQAPVCRGGSVRTVRQPHMVTPGLVADSLTAVATGDDGRLPVTANVLDFELGCPRLGVGARASASGGQPAASADAAPAVGPQPDHALLAVMAMQAFSEPRGHVHNGPRVPYCGPPPAATRPTPPQRGAADQAAAAARGWGYVDGVLQGVSWAAVEGGAARYPPGGGGGKCGPGSPPDSPLSQASTLWEHLEAVGSYAGQEVHRPRWRGAGSGSGSGSSLGAEAGGPARCDARTQWWNLTGRFCEAEDGELRLHVLPHAGFRAGAPRRQPWWRRWLLAR